MLRGGPKALLSTPAAPNKFTGGAGEKVQPARLWLEILAVYETFGSLTSGEVPTLIGPGQNDWWFDTSGMSTYHRYSVEQVFGMSRSMIALVATVRREVTVILIYAAAYPPYAGLRIPLSNDQRTSDPFARLRARNSCSNDGPGSRRPRPID